MADGEKQKAFYSIHELSQRWGVSRSTIYREVDRGRLNRRHIGGQVRFSADDVASYEQSTAEG